MAAEAFDELPQRRLGAVGQVVGVSDCRRVVGGEEHRPGHVVDVAEVEKLAAVAEVGELAPAQGVEKLRKEPPVPGSVDEAGADDDRCQPVPLGGDPHHPFGVDLGVHVGIAAVAQRGGLVGAAVLAEAVDRQRAQVDDPLDAAGRAGGQEVASAFDVDPAGVVVREPVAHQPGAVEDPLRSLDRFPEAGDVAEVTLDQFHSGLVQLRRPFRPPDEDPDLVALVHQCIHQPPADEPGGPGDDSTA